MAGSSALAVASLEAGAMTRLTIIAMTRSRGRLGCVCVFLGPSKRSRPIARAVPSTAATWPCGSERSTVKASWPAGMTTPPFKTPRRPSTCSAGQWLRLSSVRLRMRFPVPIALAKQDGGRRIPVGDGFDIHGDDHTKTSPQNQRKSRQLHGYKSRPAQPHM